MNGTLLVLTAGLPYNRRIRITEGTKLWPTVDHFEIHSQVRVSESPTATLKSTLTPFFTKSVDGEDIVIDLALTGENTRQISGGFYDVVVSDIGTIDARALRVLYGQLRVNPMVTVTSNG